MRSAGKIVRGLQWMILLAVVAGPQTVQACSVCYGEPDSPAAQGLTWAILALGLMVGVVLSGVVMFFVHANRSAAASIEEGAE